jgi:hypothetical protein
MHIHRQKKKKKRQEKCTLLATRRRAHAQLDSTDVVQANRKREKEKKGGTQQGRRRRNKHHYQTGVKEVKGGYVEARQNIRPDAPHCIISLNVHKPSIPWVNHEKKRTIIEYRDSLKGYTVTSCSLNSHTYTLSLSLYLSLFFHA